VAIWCAYVSKGRVVIVSSIYSRSARGIALALMLALVVPGGASAVTRSATNRFAPRKAPLSATVSAGSDTAWIKIVGGAPPFTVSMVGASGERVLYKGVKRSAKVPLLAGKTVYRVSSGRGSRIAGGASTESTVVTGIGDQKFWVADNTKRMLHRFDAALETVTASVWVPGHETSASVLMRNVTVRSSDGHLFVAFSDNVNGVDTNRLIELDSNGSAVATWSVPSSYKLQDATFDASGNAYAIDRGTGSYADNRVRVTKLSPTGAVLDSTQTVLPPNGITYPMANLTNMIEWLPGIDRLVARINTGTFVILDPATLTPLEFRYSGDRAYTCMTLNANSPSNVVLYTGGSGFNMASFFGKQSDFLGDVRYLDSTIGLSPFHDWKVTPTLPAIADVSVDANDYVYTIQHDGVNGLTKAYVVDPDGVAVKDFVLPAGTKIAVVR